MNFYATIHLFAVFSQQATFNDTSAYVFHCKKIEGLLMEFTTMTATLALNVISEQQR